MKYKVGDFIHLKINKFNDTTNEYEFEGIDNLCLTEKEVDKWNHPDIFVEKTTEQRLGCKSCWVVKSDMNYNRCKHCRRYFPDMYIEVEDDGV